MKSALMVVALVGGLVYAVTAQAQPAPAPAMTAVPATAQPAPASAVVARPVAAAPAPAAAVAPQPADAAPEPAMAAAVPVAPMDPAASQPAPAAASPGAPVVSPKASGWDAADKWVGRITSLLLALLTVMGLILGWVKGQDWRQALKTDRWQKILGYVEDAFPMVESLAKATSWKGDDKLVEFLKRINDWLKGEGEKELSAEEVALLRKEAADRAAQAKAENGGTVDTVAVKRGK